MGRLLCALAMFVLGVTAAGPVSAGDFAKWAAVVVAGDWRAHGGGDTDAFDNARRDVAKALVAAGFSPGNVVQMSLRPARPGDPPNVGVSPRAVAEGFEAVAGRANEGCLFYLTSHGSPDGAVFGPLMTLTPTALDVLLRAACPGRPAVVVVSACFSGVFATGLASPERLIMTASRADRSSFGCGDKDKYPYFDACVLASLPHSTDFLTLSIRTRACVDKRETDEQLDPPSEPQTSIGAQARMVLPLQRFDHR